MKTVQDLETNLNSALATLSPREGTPSPFPLTGEG